MSFSQVHEKHWEIMLKFEKSMHGRDQPVKTGGVSWYLFMRALMLHTV